VVEKAEKPDQLATELHLNLEARLQSLNAQYALTKRKNAVDQLVEHATNKLVSACAKHPAPEARAQTFPATSPLPATTSLRRSRPHRPPLPTTPSVRSVLIERLSAVVHLVVHATRKLVNVYVKLVILAVLAAISTEKSEQLLTKPENQSKEIPQITTSTNVQFALTKKTNVEDRLAENVIVIPECVHV